MTTTTFASSTATVPTAASNAAPQPRQGQGQLHLVFRGQRPEAPGIRALLREGGASHDHLGRPRPPHHPPQRRHRREEGLRLFASLPPSFWVKGKSWGLGAGEYVATEPTERILLPTKAPTTPHPREPVINERESPLFSHAADAPDDDCGAGSCTRRHRHRLP